MGRNLKILEDNEWFLRGTETDEGDYGYPICYRLVLCYSLANYIMRSPNPEVDIKLRELLEIFNNRNEKSFRESDFLEVYPFYDNGQKVGYIVIDDADGCYPLVLRYRTKTEKDRVNAFKLSLKDVIRNFDQFQQKLRTLNSLNDWDESFQKELSLLFQNKVSE